MIRVVLTGPESTGKTTLAKQLCEVFKCDYVKEHARGYLEALNRSYVKSDLLEIARGQVEANSLALDNATQVISDTDLLTIKIWSEYKYGQCDKWIIKKLETDLPDMYLICYPDLDWEDDPQRENPNDRIELFEIYLAEVKRLEVSFVVVKGKGEHRLEMAVNALKEIFV